MSEPRRYMIGNMDVTGEPPLEEIADHHDRMLELTDTPTEFLPIAVASLINSRLTQIIEAYLVNFGKKKSPSKRLLGLSSNAAEPGISYEHRVNLALALGLIPASLGECLDLIDKIRNHFAHVPKPNMNGTKVRGYLLELNRETKKLLYRDYGLNDSELKSLVESADSTFEWNPEIIGRDSLIFAWINVAVMLDKVEARISDKRLVPLTSDADLWGSLTPEERDERKFEREQRRLQEGTS